VARSGQLGLVKILNEASIGSGVRRVEALVGLDALAFAAKEHILVSRLAELYRVKPEEVGDRVEQTITALRDAEKELIAQHGAAGLDWLGLITITEPTKDGWGPLLIVLYGASQLTSTYLMSQNMQPAQRALMLLLPIAFIPFVLNFPSGLMLYWLTTNLWTTGQGLITRRLTPKPQPPPKKSSRTPPKSEVAVANAAAAVKPAADQKPVSTPPRVRKVKRKKGGSRR